MKFGFLLVMLLPIIGQVYVSWRVWQLLPLSLPLKVLVVALMAVAFVCLVVNFMLPAERVPLWLMRAVYETGTSWPMILLYLFMLVGVLDLGRLCHVVPDSFLRGSWAGTLSVLGVMLAVFIGGNIHYHHKHRQALTLHSHGLVKQPIKVVMLSDLHLGFHNPRSEFARWVDIVNAEHPDLVLIAGDIIDGNVYLLLKENVAQEWQRIQAPVYACMGNHEYFTGQRDAMQFIEQAGIHLLRDTVVVVGDLCLIGRDDRLNRHRRPLSQLMQAVPQGKYTISLDHQPNHLEEAEQCGIDFQLSGHTHHGQIWPISWITDAMFECSHGEHRRGNTRYYVSSGLGIWGGKFRIGTRSEYVVATIQ
ncbi:MAG: metallophosphoesterase [Muribaculaceae bacterium]|nr:metallophosphoesterase [Muribaculaceae bacterium]